MGLNYLSRMNTNHVKELEKKTNLVFLPIGPTEVHATHLPMATDVVSAVDMVERAAEKLRKKGIECLIAPALNYCLADVANVFHGNTTLRPETVAAVVGDICVSVAKWGFTKIVIVCGHGEPRNVDAINKGVEYAKGVNKNIDAVVSQWLGKGMPLMNGVCKEEHPELDIHAGEIETGLMLNRCPELVDLEALSKLEPNWNGTTFFEDLANGIDNFIDLGAPLAYLGDPRIATAETGEKVYDIFSDIVTDEAEELVKK